VFGVGLVTYLVGFLFDGLGAVTGAPLPASALGFSCPALFPVAGSYYDPAVAAMITAAVAGVLALTGAGRRTSGPGGSAEVPS
jgi:hypothetical protein